MPDTTPIYGFTYPCPGEVVNEASFSTLTGQIDTVLAALDVAADDALTRPHAGVLGNAESVPVSVGTLLPTPQVVFPTAGVWEAIAASSAGSGETTIDAHRLLFRHNATDYHGQTQNTEGNQGFRAPWAHNVFVAAAGDTLRVIDFWAGTGGPRTLVVTLFTRLICYIE